MAGKGAVGGIEEVMALIEDDAGLAGGRLLILVHLGCPQRLVDGDLVQDEGVVGDDDVGLARRPHGALDEALAIMGASRIDALAAPVGEAQSHGARRPRLAVAGQRQEPGGEVAAHHVAIAAEAGPAGDQRSEEGAARAARQAPHRLLQVEQAEIVLTTFSHHDAVAALGRIGDKPAAFLVELALQVLGVGGNPHRRRVAPRPQPGGRQITEGLAETGAGFSEKDVVLGAAVAGGEGERCLGAIGHLLRARLGPGAKQVFQEGLCFFCRDRLVAAGRARPLIGPVLQTVPHVEAIDEGGHLESGRASSDGCDDRRRPGPVGAGEEGRCLKRLARGGEMRAGQAVEEGRRPRGASGRPRHPHLPAP